ncbi:MAG TPA: NAD(P)H-hydrate dehydratase [Thermoplasmata archaeon]|nr:NAD(P)H-hydrate dehydratase [Thermoplasmata archaeon]
MAAPDGPLRTSLEMAIAERNAVALGVSVQQLMENAGRVVAEAVMARVSDPAGRIVVLAGAGNNGGDGTAAVHYLRAAGRAPELWMVAGAAAIRSIAARRAFERVAGLPGVHEGVPTTADLVGAAVAVDAMLGTGQSGELREPYRSAVTAIRNAHVPVLAVDLPTGFDGPDRLPVEATVTLSASKVGLDRSSGGEITVRPIGIPDAAFDRTGPGEYLAYPRPTTRGRRARVAIVGGGPFTGAPALAGLAALRSGAERATIYAPRPAAEAIRALTPDLVVVASGTERLRLADLPALLASLRSSRVGAVVVGMGLGRDPETLLAVRSLLTELAGLVPLVVDADALDALPDRLPAAASAPVVVTPNEGEFARVFAPTSVGLPASPTAAVEAVARARGCTVVRKGAEDVVASPERTVISGPHSPSMNVGGSGDVLGGVIGRLLAEPLPGFAAARLATHWVGDAGRLAAAERGDGLLATDLLEALPVALREGLRYAPLG